MEECKTKTDFLDDTFYFSGLSDEDEDFEDPEDDDDGFYKEADASADNPSIDEDCLTFDTRVRFKDVIGYDNIKNQLKQILSIMKDRKRFAKLGAGIPKGCLLFGEPGVGKTMIASAFVNESRRRCYLLRRTKSDGKFCDKMAEIFASAKKNQPSIIFLDDMDKFQINHRSSEEFNILQSLVDSVSNDDVYIIATINSAKYIPQSLLRDGRFDFHIEVTEPTEEDAARLLKVFMADKAIDRNLSFEDFSAMAKFSSTIGMKTLVNKSAMIAGCHHHDSIHIEDVVEAFLKGDRNKKDKTPPEYKTEYAVHEAGHLTVAECCQPGSVGFATVLNPSRGDAAGFISLRQEIRRLPHSVMLSLAGKCAVEIQLGRQPSGCFSDLQRATHLVSEGIRYSGTSGFAFVKDPSESASQRHDGAVTSQLEFFAQKTRYILAVNRGFLEAAADLLLSKGYLLVSDIRQLKKEHPIRTDIIQGI